MIELQIERERGKPCKLLFNQEQQNYQSSIILAGDSHEKGSRMTRSSEPHDTVITRYPWNNNARVYANTITASVAFYYLFIMWTSFLSLNAWTKWAWEATSCYFTFSNTDFSRIQWICCSFHTSRWRQFFCPFLTFIQPLYLTKFSIIASLSRWQD